MSQQSVLFDKTLNTLLRFPKLVLLLVFIATLGFISQARQVNFDSSLVGFLATDNPDRLVYNDFKERFGLSEYFIILLEAEDVLAPAFLQKLETLQQAIEQNVWYVANVESLLSIDHIKSDQQSIEISPLISDALKPISTQKREFILANDYYQQRVINEKGNASAIIIELSPFIVDKNSGKRHMLLLDDVLNSFKSLQAVVQNQQVNFNNSLYLGGTPAAVAELSRASKHDFLVFSSLCLLLVAVALGFVFRQLSAVLAPLFLLFCTVSITLSLMVIGKFPMQITSAMLPAFLLSVCVADSVHFLRSFYYQRQFLSVRQALGATIAHTFKPIVFTSLTTAVGLLSFANAGILPVASFGVFSAIGVLLACLLTFICLPCFLLLAGNNFSQGKALFALPTKPLVSWLMRYYRAVIITGLGFLAVSILAGNKLALSHDSLTWFDKTNPVRQSVEAIDKKLGGTMVLELLISKKDGSSIVNYKLWQALDKWLLSIKGQAFAGVEVKNHSSLISLVKEVHQALAPNSASALPQGNALLAQELLLLELDASNTVAKYINHEQTSLRISINTPWQDAANYQAFIAALNQSLNDRVTGFDITIQNTGMVAILNTTLLEMLHSMVQSYLLAGLVISMMMMLLLKRWRLGLYMMLPNILPIAMLLSIMVVFAMPLDMFTLLIGSIAIGLIVDDSIHFVHSFQQHFQEHGDVSQALQETFNSTGQALISTSMVLSLGFLVFCFSYLNNLQNFGILTACCIVLALVADFILAPAILIGYYKNNN